MISIHIIDEETGASASVKNGSLRSCIKVLSQFRKTLSKDEVVLNKSKKATIRNVKEENFIDALDEILKKKEE